MARGLLESEGIEAEVFDEYTIAVQPLYSTALGGVKLVVLERDVGQALDILREQRAEATAYDEEKLGRCPRCESVRIGDNPLRFGIILLAIVTLGIAWLLLYRKYRCEECGHSW